jgi:hypothetical protein
MTRNKKEVMRGEPFELRHEPTRHSMTLFIADRKMNEFMRCFDLRPPHKWYVFPQKVSFTTTSKVDDDYVLRLIEKSKGEPEKWVPAIEYMGNIYHDPTVMELSDGQKIVFLPPVEEPNVVR